MKKTLVSIFMAAAMIISGNAYAQTPTDGNTGATTQKEKVENGKKDKKGEHKKNGFKKDKPAFNPFDGIQLTEEQQQKLQVLRQGLGPVELTPQQQAKIPENKNLTKEQKQQLKKERKAKKLEAKKNYLKGVKETLTPDQYVIFLENCYLYAPEKSGNKAARKPNGMKPGARGEKGGKSPKVKSNQ